MYNFPIASGASSSGGNCPAMDQTTPILALATYSHPPLPPVRKPLIQRIQNYYDKDPKASLPESTFMGETESSILQAFKVLQESHYEHNFCNIRVITSQEPILQWAIRKNFNLLAQYLINHGADLEAHNSYGMTSLMVAALMKSNFLVDRLCDAGASVDAKLHEDTALDMIATLATQCPDEEISCIGVVIPLLQQGARTSATFSRWTAAQREMLLTAMIPKVNLLGSNEAECVKNLFYAYLDNDIFTLDPALTRGLHADELKQAFSALTEACPSWDVYNWRLRGADQQCLYSLITDDPCERLIYSLPPDVLKMNGYEKEELIRALTRLTSAFFQGPGIYLILSGSENAQKLGLDPQQFPFSFVLGQLSQGVFLGVYQNIPFARGFFKKIKRAAVITLDADQPEWKKAVCKEITEQKELSRVAIGYVMQQKMALSRPQNTNAIFTPIIFRGENTGFTAVYFEEEGGSPADLFAPFSLEDKLRITKTVFKVIQAANDDRRIHGDIKFDNVLVKKHTGKLRSRYVRVIDWDLEKHFRHVDGPKPDPDPTRFKKSHHYSEAYKHEEYLPEGDIYGVFSMWAYNFKEEILSPQSVSVRAVMEGWAQRASSYEESLVYRDIGSLFQTIADNSQQNWNKSDFRFYTAQQLVQIFKQFIKFLETKKATDIPSWRLVQPEGTLQLGPPSQNLPGAPYQQSYEL